MLTGEGPLFFTHCRTGRTCQGVLGVAECQEGDLYRGRVPVSTLPGGQSSFPPRLSCLHSASQGIRVDDILRTTAAITRGTWRSDIGRRARSVHVGGVQRGGTARLARRGADRRVRAGYVNLSSALTCRQTHLLSPCARSPPELVLLGPAAEHRLWPTAVCPARVGHRRTHVVLSARTHADGLPGS